METIYEDIGTDFIVQLREVKEGSSMPHMHYHEVYEIYILIKGNRTYMFDNEIIEIAKNDVVLINPKIIHATSGGEYKRYIVHFSDKYLKKYFTDEAITELMRCFDYKKIHIRDIEIESIQNSIEKLSVDSGNIMELVNILRIMNANAGLDKIECKNKTAADVIEYVARNYDTICGLDEIADKFFITKAYLCRVFKENTGISVVKYINTKKVLDACKILVSTNKNVDEIAIQSGFNSSEYFCRTFKNVTGKTPGQYRRAKT